MYEGVLSAIGNTPLARLSKIFGGLHFKLYAKLEALNPGGSMKDRPALDIIRHGLKTGAIHSGTVVIESSSGNMGIGLAQICSYYGLRFICVVDQKITLQNHLLLQAYGAEVDMVKDVAPTAEGGLEARLNRVQDLLRSTKNSFWPNQYANEYNAIAHRLTMSEIVSGLGGKVDYLFCAVSTCGTLRGCAEYIREKGLNVKIFAVDAVGSVIFGGQRSSRLIPGHGAAVRPALFQSDLAFDCIHVTDKDCVVGCRRLARQEAILAGGSSGALITAVEKVRDGIPCGATCVLIIPDRGERYLNTIYSDTWVEEHFGDISHLWKDSAEPTLGAMATY